MSLALTTTHENRSFRRSIPNKSLESVCTMPLAFDSAPVG